MNQLYEILVAIIVGATEGFTEFLPISSTAHNGLVGQLLLGGKDIGLDVSNIFQFGALIAIVQFFWSDISTYFSRLKNIITNKEVRQEFIGNIKNWLKKTKTHEQTSNLEVKNSFEIDTTIAQITIATIPTSIIGLLMRKYLDDLRSTMWIGFFLIIGSLLMAIADWYYQKNLSKQNPNKTISPLEAFNIGLFQTLGIFPGISRSGATLSGSFFLGINRIKAVRFGFLVGIPILALAGLKDILSVIGKLKNHPFFPTDALGTSVDTQGFLTVNISVLSILVGTITAYFVAYLSLKWLLKYLSTHNFTPFIFYRIILGIILLAVSGMKF